MAKKLLVVVAAVLIGLFVVLTVLPSLLNYTTHGMDIQFYDEDGNPIGEPMAFLNPNGDIVAGFTASVWWKIVGTNADLTTLSITGTLKVSVLNTLDRWNTLDTEEIDSVTAELTHSKNWDFETLLSNYMDEDYKTTGWPIRIESSITAQMSDTEGNVLDPQTVTDAAQFLLTWYEGSFTLESKVSYGYP